MKNLIITFALMLGFAVSANAQSYTVDFVDGNPWGADVFGERGVDDGTVLNFGGVYVKFSASSTSGDGFAYFDGGDAGLGVCTTLVSTQCVPNSDDNLTSGETLTLQFYSDQAATDLLNVTIGGLVFRDSSHNIIGDLSTLLFDVDAAATTVTSMTGFGWSTMGESFNFAFDDGKSGQQYYISSMLVSEIPEPATWLMMIIGFGIVSASTRRSRRHSARIVKTC